MSISDKPKPPDFDDEFMQAVAKWKEQHKINDDDTIWLLVDLFEIHQKHWDEIRRRQFPSLEEFAADIATLTEAAQILKDKALQHARTINLSAAIFAAVAAALAGFLIGKFL